MLRSLVSQQLKDAMRAKDVRAVSTLRLISAAIKDRDIAARSDGVTDGIGDDEILQLLQKMIKQRQESIRLYEEGGRLELAQQEREEVDIIERFLPKQLSADEVAAAVDSVIADIGAGGIKDMGPLMAALRERYAGTMDFAKASAVAKARLMR
ncbi:MAG: GatB/YqeY domain-containing protein [Alphaproteobacteria bacterium]|nr:GatB/YqeY domain-containing protein [Alphaproteobacteria bacterium]MCB9929995.1 GatB/YqeY domain-containing protein [Alphaproteobacteria bacterium]